MHPNRPIIALVLNATLLPALPAMSADLPPRTAPPPPPAFVALQTGGFYVGTRQALSFAEPTTFTSSGGSTSFETRYETGRQMSLIAGYGFVPMFGLVSPRVELEASFGNPSVDKHTVRRGGADASQSETDSFGELRSYTGLLNGYLDFNLARAGFGNAPWLARLSPYVGGGIGMSQVTLRRQGISATGVVMDGSDTRLTWQLSAGVSYAIFDKTTFELGYRHMRTSGLEFEARDGTVSKTDLVNNMVTVGIRRSF